MSDNPRGGVDTWKLYSPVTKEDGRLGGFVAPNGSKYLFGPEERLGSGFTVVTTKGLEQSVAEWILGKRSEMNETFNTIHPMLKKAYLAIIDDYPDLTLVEVVGKKLDKNDPPGTFRLPTKELPIPSVIVNESANIDYEWFFANRALTLKLIALKIGVDITVLQKNQELLATFFLAHEFGHAKHYQELLSEGHPNPTQKWRDNRAEEFKRFTYPGKRVSDLRHMHKKGLLEAEFVKYQSYFFERGVYTIDQLFDRAETEYREMPQEEYADEFAARLMKRHWKELGIDQLTGIKSPGIR